MYNLFVSGNNEDWQGDPFVLELPRCIREFTDPAIMQRYGAMDATAINAIKRLPCIFAYETGCRKPPKFGRIVKVSLPPGYARIQYELIEILPFLTDQNFPDLSFALDISKWEMGRSHWAVKDVDLSRELQRRGVTLPAWARAVSETVDIENHNFDVALSFPGEGRDYVALVANELEKLMGPNSYFYDDNYRAQLARPSLDILLQDIYKNRSKLVVVFLSSDYERKLWCGVEFRAIKNSLLEREYKKIMLVKTDDGEVGGIFKTDGYIDSRKVGPDELALFIQQRVDLLPAKP